MTLTAVVMSPTDFAALMLAQMEPLSEKLIALVDEPHDSALACAAIVDVQIISSTINEALAGCGSYTAPSICILSHEVRNALTAILGTLELLKRAPNVSRARVCLQALEHAIALLHGEEKCVTFSLAHLLEQSVLYFNPAAEKKGVTLLLLLKTELAECFSRPVQIQQVIYNLIGNAIKFTPANGVIVVAASQYDDDQISISVADTGCGISEELCQRLFQPRVQAPETASLGCGLGLSISYNLMQLLGGSIEVSSVLGAGTDFRARLPVRCGAHPMPDASPGMTKGTTMTSQETLRRGAVLLVEDESDLRMVFSDLITDLGLTCVEAANFDEACQRASEQPFDLMLVDGLNGRGVTLVEELRGIAAAHSYATTIVGFSGNDALAKASVDAHLPKPARLEQLVAMLTKFGVLPVSDGVS